MGTWYNTGYDGIGKEEQRIESLHGPNRIWIPVGQSKEVVFVDQEPACIYEHNAKINGHWRNWHTCLQGMHEECPSCEQLGEKARYYIGYVTVVDLSLWVDKRGNKFQYELKFLGGKLSTLKKWKRKVSDFGGLTGKRVRIHRDSSDDPNTGGEFEVLSPVKDPDKLFSLVNFKGKKLSEMFDAAESKPEEMERLLRFFQGIEKDEDGRLIRRVPAFNYMHLLKPRFPAEIRALLKGASLDSDGKFRSGGSGQSSLAGAAAGEDGEASDFIAGEDSDIPF
jgi:hypothetical protein